MDPHKEMTTAMTAHNHQVLIEAAAHWALHYSKRAPKPLFAVPCFYFTLDNAGLPNSESIHFVRVTDAFTTSPEGLLRRAKELRHPPGTHAAVLVYALGEDDELYADALGAPVKFLVYAYIPASEKHAGFLERRLVSGTVDALNVEPDRHLPFDVRRPPAAPGLRTTAGADLHIAKPASELVH